MAGSTLAAARSALLTADGVPDRVLAGLLGACRDGLGADDLAGDARGDSRDLGTDGCGALAAGLEPRPRT
jgi:hypothetical protein